MADDVTVSFGADDSDLNATIAKIKANIAQLAEGAKIAFAGMKQFGLTPEAMLPGLSGASKTALESYMAAQKLPPIPPGGGGGGGGGPPAQEIVKTKEAVHGLVEEIGGMAGQFVKWGLIWQAFEAGIKAVGEAYKQFTAEADVARQAANSFGGTIEAGQEYLRIYRDAQQKTSMSWDDWQKFAPPAIHALEGVGMSARDAASETAHLGEIFENTGADLRKLAPAVDLGTASFNQLSEAVRLMGPAWAQELDALQHQEAAQRDLNAELGHTHTLLQQQRQDAEGLSDTLNSFSEKSGLATSAYEAFIQSIGGTVGATAGATAGAKGKAVTAGSGLGGPPGRYAMGGVGSGTEYLQGAIEYAEKQRQDETRDALTRAQRAVAQPGSGVTIQEGGGAAAVAPGGHGAATGGPEAATGGPGPGGMPYWMHPEDFQKLMGDLKKEMAEGAEQMAKELGIPLEHVQEYVRAQRPGFGQQELMAAHGRAVKEADISDEREFQEGSYQRTKGLEDARLKMNEQVRDRLREQNEFLEAQPNLINKSKDAFVGWAHDYGAEIGKIEAKLPPAATGVTAVTGLEGLLPVLPGLKAAMAPSPIAPGGTLPKLNVHDQESSDKISGKIDDLIKMLQGR